MQLNLEKIIYKFLILYILVFRDDKIIQLFQLN